MIGFPIRISFCCFILFGILFRQLFGPLFQQFPHLHRVLRNLAAKADVLPQRFEGLRDLGLPGFDLIARFGAVQLAALGKQIRHGLFLCLAVGIQLVKRVDFMAR